MIHRLAFCLLAASLVACGGGGGLDTAGDAIRQNWQKVCQKLHSCRDSAPATDEQFEAAFGANVSACVAMFAADAEADGVTPEDYDAAEEAGTLLFDAENAAICLGAIDRITCDQIWTDQVPDSPPECDMVFEGTVETGGACVIDEECISEFCDGTCF